VNILQHLNFEYTFERRRYGHGSTTKFFTWVSYRLPGQQWKEFGGDPWMKSRLNKKEVGEVLSKITLRVLPVGQRVNTHSGEATILGVEGEYFRIRLDNYSQTSLLLHPGHITEVL
jgi:hypothetical protein